MEGDAKVWVAKRKCKGGKVTYHLRWLDTSTGLWKSRKVGTDRKRAERAAADLEGKLSDGTYSEVKRVTWEAFVQEHVAKLPGKANAVQAERALVEFGAVLGNLPPHRVAYRDIETFVAKCRDKGNSTPTVLKKLRYLRCAFNRGIKRGYLVKNPMAGWEWERVEDPVIRVVTEAEEAVLVAKAKALYGTQAEGFVIVALGTGGRRSELCGLTWQRIDLDGAEVLFVHTKGKKPRVVPVNPEVVDTLRRLKPMTQQQDGPFTNIDPQLMTKRWERIAEHAGLADVTLHDLRRTYVTRLILAGVELPTVQKLAGHSTIQTTLRYYNAVHKENLRAAVDKLRKRNVG